MSASPPAVERTYARNAEQQMRMWALGLEVQDRIRQGHRAEQFSEQICPYVALSRETGADGGDVARLVGQQLGWEVIDRALLDYMSERYQIPRDMLEFVDETTSNWVVEIFGEWISRQVVTQSEYVAHLGHIALLAARHGNKVFVGRGIQYLLPRHRGIGVQVVAPLEFRIQRVMARQQMSSADAKRFIAIQDKGRRQFVRHYFHHDVSDPHLYDLVVNRAMLSVDEAAELIVSAVRQRFGGT